MSHTPGPWSYDDESGQVIAPKVGYHHLTPPVICEVDALMYGEDSANGKLIAAAPELLMLLREWVDPSIDGIGRNELVKRSFAAIAKAEQ